MSENIKERGVRARELTSGIRETTAEMLAEVQSGHYGKDVSSPLGPHLHQFTSEQINDCCSKLDKMCRAFHSERTAMVMALQIIRQLQAELDKKVSIDLGADKHYD